MKNRVLGSLDVSHPGSQRSSIQEWREVVESDRDYWNEWLNTGWLTDYETIGVENKRQSG